jgi:hypothetical protein
MAIQYNKEKEREMKGKNYGQQVPYVPAHGRWSITDPNVTAPAVSKRKLSHAIGMSESSYQGALSPPHEITELLTITM